jgi:hypothetical protein
MVLWIKLIGGVRMKRSTLNEAVHGSVMFKTLAAIVVAVDTAAISVTILGAVILIAAALFGFVVALFAGLQALVRTFALDGWFWLVVGHGLVAVASLAGLMIVCESIDWVYRHRRLPEMLKRHPDALRRKLPWLFVAASAHRMLTRLVGAAVMVGLFRTMFFGVTINDYEMPTSLAVGAGKACVEYLWKLLGG